MHLPIQPVLRELSVAERGKSPSAELLRAKRWILPRSESTHGDDPGGRLPLTRRKRCVGNSYPSCATADSTSDSNQVPPRPACMQASASWVMAGPFTRQADVGRIAALGTAGQFRLHLVSLGFPMGCLRFVTSCAGDLGETVIVAW